MHIQCKKCNYCEKTDKSFFVKLIGGATAGMGYWAWVAYFFAGTGFAMPICIAIMAGGGAMLAFSDTIVPWISKMYDCPECHGNDWVAIDDEAVEKIRLAQQKIQQLNTENAKYKLEIKELSDDLNQKKNEIQEYIKTTFQENVIVNTQNSYDDDYVKKLENDFYFLMEQWENQESKILELVQSQEAKDELENVATAYTKQEMKVIDKIKMRFRKLYQKVSIEDKSYKRLVRMNDSELLKFEQEIKKLNEGQLSFRDDIYGADVKEVDFDGSGRFYIRKIDDVYSVVCVGDKNTQDKDIEWLKKHYPK